MKNGDKIRSMTDEELEEFIDDLVDGQCSSCPAHKECETYEDIDSCGTMIEDWLKQKTE